jgi:integrase
MAAPGWNSRQKRTAAASRHWYRFRCRRLAQAIATCPSPPDALTLLTNQWGKPYSKRAFNEQFRKWCDEAGLDERVVPHSMRKGGSKRMADSGCNELELMAQGGWHTSKEVQRYTRDYDRKQAAIRAADKLAKVATAKDNVVPLTVAAKRS